MSSTKATSPIIAPPVKRSSSQMMVARRDRFLKSLGIPSFQHPSNLKSSSSPFKPNEDDNTLKHKTFDTPQEASTEEDKENAGEQSNGLLSPRDIGKRGSTIRLRNYRSIGNLDVKANKEKMEQEGRDHQGSNAPGLNASASLPLDMMAGNTAKGLDTDRDWVVKLHSLTSHSGLLGSPDSNEQQDPVFEVKVPGQSRPLRRTVDDFALLHDGLAGLSDNLPELPTNLTRYSTPGRTPSALSSASNTSPIATTRLPPKKRQSSFLHNLQSKVRSTIRAVSDGSKSGITSPVSPVTSLPGSPGPLSPALPPENSLSQTVELGMFDFETGKNGRVTLATTSPVEQEVQVRDRQGGMTLNSASALVTAMSFDQGFAKKASRPDSMVIDSGGLYGRDSSVNGNLLSPLLPPLQLPSPLERRELMADAKHDNGSVHTETAAALSLYLFDLAQRHTVTDSIPWRKFITTGNPGDRQLSPGSSGRIGWNAEMEQALQLERQKLALDKMSTAERKKAVRRSRSLGEGLLNLFKERDSSAKTAPLVAAHVDSEREREKVKDSPPLNSPSEVEISGTVTPPLQIVDCINKDLDRTPPARRVETALKLAIDRASPPQLIGESELLKPSTESASGSTSAISTSSSEEADEWSTPNTDQHLTPKKRKTRSRKEATVEDFELIRVLGKGCAGKVILVKHAHTGGLFAMKAILKRHVLEHQELTHTLTEQSVLRRMSSEECHNPFIVKLWWSFHDKDNLYLVLDFLPGGDLATQLSRWGRLGRDRARFYTCEIVEGVEALHAAGVIYRDLKPENILLGSDGHVSLADFGLAAEFPESKGPLATLPSWMKTFAPATPEKRESIDPGEGRDVASSFVGTAEYLAPEVIKGQSYSYEVDWWALGTMLYEALIGNTPFWVDNHAEMYMRVVHEELRFPEDRELDRDTKSFIRGLLQKDPAFRLCEPRIRKHPYLNMVDWDHVRHKRYIPPYIPPTDASLEYDVQNFDKSFLEMDLALKDVATSASDDPDVEEDGSKIESDDTVFDGYQYRHQDIISVFDPETEGLEGVDNAEEIRSDDTEDGDEAVPELVGDVTPLDSARASLLDRMDGEDEVGTTTVKTRPSSEAKTAMLQRIQALTTEASSVKTSRHSREILNRGPGDRSSRIIPSENEDEEWDIVEDVPEAVAKNGRDTLFARGVVDKYKLALLKRKESTIRKKPSIKFKRSPASSTMLGRGGEEAPPIPSTPKMSALKYRLRNRMKTPKATPIQQQQQRQLGVDGTDDPVRQAALRSHSAQSFNSAGWSTEDGSEGAPSTIESRLALNNTRRESAGV